MDKSKELRVQERSPLEQWALVKFEVSCDRPLPPLPPEDQAMFDLFRAQVKSDDRAEAEEVDFGCDRPLPPLSPEDQDMFDSFRATTAKKGRGMPVIHPVAA